jgi:hypothetical protein
VLYARLRYGIDLKNSSPEQAVARASIPVLLIHGSADDNIPLRHSQRLKAGNPGSVLLWEVPTAGHSGALGTDPQEFEQRVIRWFEQAISWHVGAASDLR